MSANGEEGPVLTSSTEKGRTAQGFPSGAQKLHHGVCLVTVHQTSPRDLWSLCEVRIYICTKCCILVGHLQCYLQNCGSICVQNRGSNRRGNNSISFFFCFLWIPIMHFYFFIHLLLFCVCFLHICMYTICLVGPHSPEEDTVAPGTGVRHGCELPYWFWELSAGPLQKIQVPLEAQASL